LQLSILKTFSKKPQDSHTVWGFFLKGERRWSVAKEVALIFKRVSIRVRSREKTKFLKELDRLFRRYEIDKSGFFSWKEED
jgi:hypothetical protein